jgi:DNA-binding beta-propeller fold protein YncE
MKHPSLLLFAAGLASFATAGLAQTAPAATPYKVLTTAQFPGSGGLDYVFADSDGRRLYVARGPQVHVFDLDSLKETGTVAASAHGAVVDPASHHGFCSSRAIVMFDTQTLSIIKTITVQGNPDGMVFEPLTERVYVLSHAAPNVTVLDAKDGSIVGTIDLGGAPEQAQSDGQGHVYIDVEDKDQVAVVDAKTLKVTASYDLGGKGGGPGGLGLDAKNHILFAMCHTPATCVVLNADDGKILATLPIGTGTDGGGFNPATMEAFSSQGDGTLTIIKENSPTSFEVEQTVQTKSRAKTCTLDAKTNHIVLITTEPLPPGTPGAAPAPATPAPGTPAAGAATPPAAGQRRGGRGGGGPALLDILVVGR